MSTGKLVSIVNTDNTRYEGILHLVDQATQTIQLTDVQSYGTESRTAVQFIPPYPSIYPQITFQRQSIAQLTSIVERTPMPKPPQPSTTATTSTDSTTPSESKTADDDAFFNSKTLDIDHSKPVVSTYSKEGFFDKTNRRAASIQYNNVATFGQALPGAKSSRQNNPVNNQNRSNNNNNNNNNNQRNFNSSGNYGRNNNNNNNNNNNGGGYTRNNNNNSGNGGNYRRNNNSGNGNYRRNDNNNNNNNNAD